MSQYQGIFKRYEKKYLLSEKQYNLFIQAIQNQLAIDKFGKVVIGNIYFDTPDFRLIRTSLEKPIYKEKLRLRSYGTPKGEDIVFVELKKKYKGIVYKRRVKMELSEAEQYLYKRRPFCQPSQITKEVDWFLNFYPDIKPAMYISYNRIAMYGIENPDLRVTFDGNILWRKDHLHLESGSWGNSLLEKGQILMEIKIPGTMPIWLSHILDERNIYPTSFSKYGRSYIQLMQERIKGEIKYA